MYNMNVSMKPVAFVFEI